jgi:hypothetical protein
MTTARTIQVLHWTAAGLTIAGAVIKIAHVAPNSKLYLIGMLLFTATELGRFAFVTQPKSRLDYLRLTGHSIALAAVVLSLFFQVEFLFVALLILAVMFVMEAFLPTRPAA